MKLHAHKVQWLVVSLVMIMGLLLSACGETAATSTPVPPAAAATDTPAAALTLIIPAPSAAPSSSANGEAVERNSALT